MTAMEIDFEEEVSAPAKSAAAPPDSFETALPVQVKKEVIDHGAERAPTKAAGRNDSPARPTVVDSASRGAFVGGALGRTLPHSLEAEEYLLSCCLLDGADVVSRCLEARIKPESFFDTKHGIIFEHLLALHAQQKPIDVSVVAEELKTSRQFDQIGGYAFLTQVSGRIPTTAQASYFIEKVREQALLREIIRSATRTVEDCYGFSGGINEFTHDIQSRLKAVIETGVPSRRLPARKLDSFRLPQPGDNSVLIGNRYLSRGDGAILSSTSGMGKSSLALQAATTWALGRRLFGGFAPSGPLRSLIFQSEDSEGDVAEVQLSLFHAMRLSDEERTQVGDRVRIVTDRVHRGPQFIEEIRRQIALFQPDIVWINPLLAFIGGDVNDAEATGAFLRDGLNGLNEPPRFAYIIVHHTAKPPKERQDRRWNEVMYDMAGSADLTNWARAIISLRATEKEGQFQLTLAKRGRRAGCTIRVPGKINPGIKFDESTTVLNIRHSTERFKPEDSTEEMPVIHWEQFEPAPEAEGDDARMGRPRVGSFADFLPIFPVGIDRSRGFRQLKKAAVEIRPTIGNSALIRILDEAVECGRLKLDLRVPAQPKYYVAAPPA